MNSTKTKHRLHKQSTQLKKEEPDSDDGIYDKSSPDSSDSPFKQAAAKKRLQKKQQKQKNNVQKFFDDEAEEGDSDDGGNEKVIGNAKDQYYKEDDLKRKTKGLNEKLAEMEQRAKKHALQKQKLEADGKFEEDSGSDGYHTAGEDSTLNEAQRELLPSVSDPKLWQVKVKKGKEKLATTSLINKAMVYAEKGTPLEILSATFTENVENYIFVEAYRKNSVIEAI